MGTTTEDEATDLEEYVEDTDTGDKDVADLNPRHRKGERRAPLGAEAWVRLGDHESVPPEYVGHIAAVVREPTRVERDETTGFDTEWPIKDALITVRLRDASNAVLTLPYEAFSEISKHGRGRLLSHA